MKKVLGIFLLLPLFAIPQIQGFGDSITRGDVYGMVQSERWLYILSQKLGIQFSDYYNYGENGAVVFFGEYECRNGGASSRINFIDKYTLANPLRNGYVTIMYGTNADLDASCQSIRGTPDWITQYRSLIQNVINYGYSRNKIILCSPPWNLNERDAMQSLATTVQGIATDLNIRYADVYTLFRNRNDYYTVDNIHPNATGNQAIANYIYSLITGPLPVHFKSIKLKRRPS